MPACGRQCLHDAAFLPNALDSLTSRNTQNPHRLRCVLAAPASYAVRVHVLIAWPDSSLVESVLLLDGEPQSGRGMRGVVWGPLCRRAQMPLEQRVEQLLGEGSSLRAAARTLAAEYLIPSKVAYGRALEARQQAAAARVVDEQSGGEGAVEHASSRPTA